MLFKKNSSEVSDQLKENAPAIAFWVASIILILFDARVLDVVYRLTGNSVLLAVGSLFATALMFFIWKNGFQYTLASKTQTTLASIGMALSLIASAVFGGMDYFVRGGLEVDAGVGTFGAVDLIFWGIPVLSVTHVIMLLWYWYADPKVSADRKKKQADDDHAFAEGEMTHATELLKKQAIITERFIVMARTFGKHAALAQLDMLGIDRAPFETIEIPPAAGHGDPAMTGAQPSMTTPSLPAGNPTSLYDAVRHGIADAQGVTRDQLQDPLTVMAGGNGHGKVVNPTVAGQGN